MTTKKTPRANLENQRKTYFQIGLVIALSMALVAFEWTTTSELPFIGTGIIEDPPIEENPPITIVEKPKPKTEEKPKPKSQTIKVATAIEVAIESTEAPDDSLDLVLTDIDDSTLWGNKGPEEREPFRVVENMPYSCACKKIRNKKKREKCTEIERRKYMARSVKYPAIARDRGAEGTVYVYFVIDEAGAFTNVKPQNSIDPDLDKEAVRVIKNMPCYMPGEQRGQKVPVQFTVPIKFVLKN